MHVETCRVVSLKNQHLEIEGEIPGRKEPRLLHIKTLHGNNSKQLS
jgi:hypothetical protein